MKSFFRFSTLVLSLLLLLTGCAASDTPSGTDATSSSAIYADIDYENLTGIELSDEKILVNGNPVSSDKQSAVYVANDIVFYHEGQDFTYGEGTKDDEHSQEEADAHTVVHITKPGTYTLSGSLSAGQIAIDLGEDAKEDPEAVVNLILNGADITCSVAPAIIFYNVYECGDSDTENASGNVDTSKAGANVILGDDSENTIIGSYVARIYESVELNEAGTEVVDSKKLHKYDAAFYSKMSMNIYGEDKGNGILNINAENEGLDSELHLTINSGNINITSGNDGINTNEDEVSVTTINGGTLNIVVNGATGEGDGIDSNGWLVINGGSVTAQACSTSGDAGIDSDMGIHINGGTVLATGNMLDRISESMQSYTVFHFMQPQNGESCYVLKTADGDRLAEYASKNDFSYLIFSSPQLVEGTYTLWKDNVQLSAVSDNMHGGMDARPDDQKPADMKIPEGGKMPQSEKPELTEVDMPQGEKPEFPKGDMPQGERPELPEGDMPREQHNQKDNNDSNLNPTTASTDLAIMSGGNYFMVME